jgi:maltose alpha-D-glucosyltransferase/alpha-amylase
VRWTRFERERENPRALAAARQGAREGTVLDVAAEEDFVSLLLDKVRKSEDIVADGRRLEFRPGGRLASEERDADTRVRAIDTEQSNTTALVGNKYVVKLFRRAEPGVNPEIEIGRFLTDVVGFNHSPPLLGTVELVEEDRRSALAVVHGFVENQGEAWTVTSAYLDRFVEEQRLLAGGDPAESSELTAYQRVMELIALRLGEMQIALASRDDVPDFAPEPITAQDASTWIRQAVRRAERVQEGLKARRDSLPESDRAMVDALLDSIPDLETRLRELLPDPGKGRKIRHHGDFHLGQVLIVKDDVSIIDFEGEPRRSVADRRKKAPAARDVASLLRSIDYSTTAALERALKGAPDEHGKIARALDIWRERSTATFVDTYRTTVADQSIWPSNAKRAERVLDFFLLEKAFYEIGYELAHRPEWLRVPLAGILRILTKKPEAT